MLSQRRPGRKDGSECYRGSGLKEFRQTRNHGDQFSVLTWPIGRNLADSKDEDGD